MLCRSVDGTKGDLMVSGSNQEVQGALCWSGCRRGAGGVCRSGVFFSAFQPSLALRARVQRLAGARRVESFPPSTPIQPFGIARI